MNFVWYAMAALIALVATLSDLYTISGTVSKPMLWSLFGVAIGQIVTQRTSRVAKKKTMLTIREATPPLPPSNVSPITRKKGPSHAYKSAKPKS